MARKQHFQMLEISKLSVTSIIIIYFILPQLHQQIPQGDSGIFICVVIKQTYRITSGSGFFFAFQNNYQCIRRPVQKQTQLYGKKLGNTGKSGNESTCNSRPYQIYMLPIYLQHSDYRNDLDLYQWFFYTSQRHSRRWTVLISQKIFSSRRLWSNSNLTVVFVLICRYSGHPWCTSKLAIVDGWPRQRGAFCEKNGD